MRVSYEEKKNWIFKVQIFDMLACYNVKEQFQIFDTKYQSGLAHLHSNHRYQVDVW